MFWSEPPPDGAPEITDAYQTTLRAVLAGSPMRADAARLPLGSNIAYVLSLAGDGEVARRSAH